MVLHVKCVLFPFVEANSVQFHQLYKQSSLGGVGWWITQTSLHYSSLSLLHLFPTQTSLHYISHSLLHLFPLKIGSFLMWQKTNGGKKIFSKCQQSAVGRYRNNRMFPSTKYVPIELIAGEMESKTIYDHQCTESSICFVQWWSTASELLQYNKGKRSINRK